MQPFHKHVNPTATPQSQPILGREAEQVQNLAGGYVFPVTDWVKLDRFLMIGTEGGSYYATEQAMTVDSAKAVLACLKIDGARVVSRIVEISQRNLAPKNDPALFALALAASHGNPATKKLAFDALPLVARIATHLFHFVTYARSQRGWGRGFATAVRKWYESKDADAATLPTAPVDDALAPDPDAPPVDKVEAGVRTSPLVYQLVKYQGRDGWTHRDLIRLRKPRIKSPAGMAALRWAVKGEVGEDTPELILAQIAAQPLRGAELAAHIRKHRLTHEMIPSESKTDPKVWDALLERMPLHALVRNLGVMSKVGLTTRGSDASKEVVRRLADQAGMQRSRLHPFAILVAAGTYRQGHGMRGTSTWAVDQSIDGALSDAFELAFVNVVPTGKRWMIGLDVSGSMGSTMNGTALSAREVACAMAMVTARVEPDCIVACFTAGRAGAAHGTANALSDLSTVCNWKRDSLQSIVKATSNLPFGATDCALPMLGALVQKWDVDVFAIYTDNESWNGPVHPTQALAEYRKQRVNTARLAACAFSASNYSVADPADAGQMNFSGLDASLPNVLGAFARGEV